MRPFDNLLQQVKELTRTVEWYKERLDALQEWQKTLPDPYRGECCDILANGIIAPWRIRDEKLADRIEALLNVAPLDEDPVEVLHRMGYPQHSE